jgi:hypothetical protein
MKEEEEEDTFDEGSRRVEFESINSIQFKWDEDDNITKQNRNIHFSFLFNRQTVWMRTDFVCHMSGKFDLCIVVGIFAPRFPNLCFGNTIRRDEAVVWLGLPLNEANTEPFWFGCTTRTVGWSFEDRVSEWLTLWHLVPQA